LLSTRTAATAHGPDFFDRKVHRLVFGETELSATFAASSVLARRVKYSQAD